MKCQTLSWINLRSLSRTHAKEPSIEKARIFQPAAIRCATGVFRFSNWVHVSVDVPTCQWSLTDHGAALAKQVPEFFVTVCVRKSARITNDRQLRVSEIAGGLVIIVA